MKNELFTLIGSRLKDLRKARGESQSDFAAYLKIPFRTYQRYEAGERIPKPAVLHHIAAVCGISIGRILTGQESDADRVADPGVRFSLVADPVRDQILVVLSELDDEGRKKVLEYAEFVLKKIKG